MGNQNSAYASSSDNGEALTTIPRVGNGMSKRVAKELHEKERHTDVPTLCTSRHPRAQRNSESSHTLQSILEAASRSLDFGRDGEDSDSTSTRDTCDSPLFPVWRSSNDRNCHHHRGNLPDMKIHPGSLMAHLFNHSSNIAPPSRRSVSSSSSSSTNKRQALSMTTSNSGNGNVNTPTPHPAPTFPDLNLKPRPAKFPHSHRPHSKVVEIPRRTQQTQAEMEQEEQLQRIYDNRTWTMYHRITEARAAARRTPAAHIGNPTGPAPLAQQQPPPQQQQHAPLQPTFGHVHPETLLLSSVHEGVENLANLQPSEDDEHPLIFGDLEE